VVGRDERSIKNTALPAHVASNPGHALQSSMGRATGCRRWMNKKMTRKRRARQGLSRDLTAKNRAGRRCQAGCLKNRRRRLSITAAKRS
jgi:hypothetical protein